MKDIIRTPIELGQAVKRLRRERKLKTIEIAAHAGRSRDVLNRLERGQDITVSALLDLLRGMGLSLSIDHAGMPTLEEMQARFAAETADDAA